VTIGGHKCGSMWKSLLDHVMFIHMQRIFTIDHMGSFNHCLSFITMDFIIDLPPSNSFYSILVVVDHLTKKVHFIPCNEIIIGENITKLFFDHVFRYQGLPKDIIFNHEPQLFKPIKSWSNICDAQLIIIKIIG